MSTSFDSFSMDGEEVHHAAAPTPQFEDHDGGFSSYGGYSGFSSSGAGDGFQADGEVPVDRSPEIFGFEDPSSGYSQSPYDSVHVENGNGNGNVFEGDDGDFATDGPVLPPPNEMQEEGFALREWRR